MNSFIIYFLPKIKRINVFIFILIYLFYAFPYPVFSAQDEDVQLILSQGQLMEEKEIGDYTYRQYMGPPYNNDIYQIFKENQLVYQSEIAFGYGLYEESELYSHGDDITGNGIPNLLVFEGGGGSSPFSNYCHVLSLGEECKVIQILPVGKFIDLNQDGILEYRTYEDTFFSWYASHAGSALPELIFEYSEGQYVLSPPLMDQPFPSPEVITRKVDEVRKQIARLNGQNCHSLDWSHGEVCLNSSVWSFMLGLLYSGHPQEALDFLDTVWPEGEEGKEPFLIEFKQRLNSSEEWLRIRDELYQTQDEKELWMVETGQLNIFSNPEGVSVILDRERKGNTPLTLSDITLGKHQLTLDKSGYEDWEEQLFLCSTGMKEINIRMTAKITNAIVKVRPTPDEKKEARVYLDGEYVGQGFCLIEDVPPGEHILKVTKPGYKVWENILPLYPGETHIVAVDLEERSRGIEIKLNEAVWIPMLLLIFVYFL